MTLQVAEIQDQFRRFADRECRSYSPLYEQRSRGIASDPELLELCTRAKAGQPVPNLMLAAVQHELHRDADHPLASYYPNLCTTPIVGDPMPAFRDFCHTHIECLKHLISTRHVQTNEIGRCTSILPAFAHLETLGSSSWAFIEIGCSAGLNLLWDHYRYCYSDGVRWGPSSGIPLECVVEGTHNPLVPSAGFAPAHRLGVDLHPVDLTDKEELAWMLALIWPEHKGRAERLRAGAQFARGRLPEIRTGDALIQMPDLLDHWHPETPVCVYHTYVLNQISAEHRTHFRALLRQGSSKRQIVEIACDYQDPPRASVRMYQYSSGIMSRHEIAFCGPHGQWIQYVRATSVRNDLQ
jgi:hypothetical protein